MNFKEFFDLSITRSALATSILIIPMIYDFYDNTPTIIKIVLISSVVVINIALISQEIKRPNIKIEELLEALIRAICLFDGNDIGDYRANIMIYNDKTNKLEMRYYYNMIGSTDWGLKVDIDPSSCCGYAFNYKRAMAVDLMKDPIAGYSSDIAKLSENIKIILSTPIRDINTGISIGVLNIDSRLEAKESSIGNQSVRETANAFAYIISKVV